MGEGQDTLFGLEFNNSLRVRAAPERKLTLDGGVVLLREIGERLGLWRLLERALVDRRDPERITHPFVELLRTLILVPAQGWFRQGDVDLLRHDPAFKLAVSNRKGERPLRPKREPQEPDGLASQPTLSRLMATLSSAVNRGRLRQVICTWAAHGRGVSPARPREEITLDLDSLPIEVHGEQPGSAHNGHYHCRCFHPLIVTWEFGDFLGGMLREGNVYTSTDALAFVRPYVAWASALARQVWLRIDAGFPSEEFLSGLEQMDCRYVARLKKNALLEALAAPHVDRILKKGDPEYRVHAIELSHEDELRDRDGKVVKKWSRARRVVLMLDERPQELMPHYFFLVTNASAQEASGEHLLQHYRKRGAVEKDYGEWLNVLDLCLSSTNRPKSSYRGQEPNKRSEPVDSFLVNEATLLVSMLTANLMHMGRAMAERALSRAHSRETFRQYVLKTPGRIARSSRYVTLWIEERRVDCWRKIGEELNKLPRSRGSPTLMALPSPA